VVWVATSWNERFSLRGVVSNNLLLGEKTMTNLALELAEEFGADNLYGVYRPIYKYTDCGPSIGFQIRGLPADHKSREGAPWREGTEDLWLYCDDLLTLGTFADMAEKGLEIIGVSVSSIVEGSDVEIEGGRIPVTSSKDEFWKLVSSVDEEAKFYWERDNSDWYLLRKKGEESTEHAFHETWGDIKFDDDMPPELQAAVEKFIEAGGNWTWNERSGTKTHGYMEWFPLPGIDGWEICEWENDSCLW
jgi:hypothetical protein